MISIIVFAGIGLGPDEAQYWTWSRHLDIGYYSKPPGVAWQIFLSTSLLGSTELGVRFSALILGTLFAYAVYRLALKAGCKESSACFAGLMAAFTPLGFFSTFLAITDGGMLLFWTLALTLLLDEKPNYLWVGLYIGLGALFKWPIYLLWLIVVLYYRTIPVRGILVSLLGLFPTLFWNYTHDFATFRHVFTIVQGGNDGGAAPNPLEFIASQVAIVSPIIFILGCVALFKPKTKALRFLAFTSFGILAVFILYSCFKKGQGNWCLFAYPSLFVLIAALFEKRLWINVGLILSSGLVLFAFAIPTLQKLSLGGIPWKINPFRHNVGWENLTEALSEFDPKTQFLFADKYQNTSLLEFYNPHQTQSYFFNLLGSRKNQFSYWPGPQKGKDGIFIAIENGNDLDKKMEQLKAFYLNALKPYFNTIGTPSQITLFSANGKSVKQALLIPCSQYLGDLPKNPEKY